MPPKLFFFHNPKAGGTSLLQWLSAAFPTQDQAPLIANDIERHRELGGRYESFRNYRFYAGHYGRDIFEAVEGGHVPITNFRDPVRRLVSLYNYFRLVVPATEDVLRDSRFACVQAAKSQGIESFLLNDDPAVTMYTRDYHVRQLTCSGFEFRGDLDAAKQLVSLMPWFFISEKADESMMWAESWVGETLPTLVKFNVTPEHPEKITELDGDLDHAVRQRNVLDCALYDFAQSIHP